MEGERIGILIVDDDQTFLGDIARLMSDRYRIVMARNATEALSAHRTMGFDIVLLDIDLGRGLDGFELLDAFRASDPNIPVIMVTRDSSASSATAALKKGAADYIDKQPDLGDLERRITRAIDEQRLLRMNDALRKEIDELYGHMVGESDRMRKLRKEITLAAQSSSPVLITGETGTGKELVAREIHRRFSPGKAFVALNCASVPRDVFDLKLFGSFKGAFTGAENTEGVFELARDGVLFLDEITRIDASLQAKLLRAIQEREFERLGSSRRMPFRGKLLASTNRDVRECLEHGLLQKDLFYRLSAFVIDVPPLRERRDDIPLLVHHFLKRTTVELKKPKPDVTDEMMTTLCARDWPGNIRELENMIERFAVSGTCDIPAAFEDGSRGGPLSSDALFKMRYEDAKSAVVREFQRKYTSAVLASCNGNLPAAAERMGLTRYGLQKILKDLEDDGSSPQQ